MKRSVVGMIAHVDAGKTTLCEALLYTAGSIRKLGRVDHRSAFLDNHRLERSRGITIFSKQAQLRTENAELCLLDTPGHVDFSAETERCLQVLDCAVLVISGTDGVQAHTETLWRLLRQYAVPTFIFVTKTDLAGFDRIAVLDSIRRRLSDSCLDFGAERTQDWYESAAMCDESALDGFAETGTVPDAELSRLIRECRLFPIIFGSGLKLENIDLLLKTLDSFAPCPEYGDEFGARVYKILRDGQGNRLSCMKITGGTLKNRSVIDGEKVTGIRVYSGERFESRDEAEAGSIVAVQGLSNTFPGQGLGVERGVNRALLEPVLAYSIVPDEKTDVRTLLPKLKQLEDEDPSLRIVWNELLRQIQVQLMGQVQTEVLTALIKERFDVDAKILPCGIMYRETIEAPVEGVGHFEPLRHYAEVHLVLEPAPQGAGVLYSSDCPEDELDRNWQNLILSELAGKRHIGVLTGSPITDMSIRLIAGRAHPKHTEGGDFREASYRALRQGLMKARSVLLEPWYSFRIELPPETLGRAINDLRAMSAQFEAEQDAISGIAPVSELNGYASTLASYTRGRGSISCVMAGYRPCHNAQQVIDELNYNAEADTQNTPDSVFCRHGAGHPVKWDEVEEYMHIDTGYGREKAPAQTVLRPRSFSIDDRELEAIMEREFGPIRRAQYTKPVAVSAPERTIAPTKQEYLIVDGYNLLFAWDELKKLSESSLDLARERLCDILRSYRSFRGCELVLVFDGYRVKGNPGEKETDGIHIIYTRENETADMYIEKLANDIGQNYSVRVVTDDSLIRLSALRSGVLRMRSKEFVSELIDSKERMAKFIEKRG